MRRADLLERVSSGARGLDSRWVAVRCQWRLRPADGGPSILRELEGLVGVGFAGEVRRRCGDAHLGELVFECLLSGRRAFSEYDALADWAEGPPPSDRDSFWRVEELFARRRSKLLRDVDAACLRGVRRGVLDARALALARRFMEELSSAGLER